MRSEAVPATWLDEYDAFVDAVVKNSTELVDVYDSPINVAQGLRDAAERLDKEAADNAATPTGETELW